MSRASDIVDLLVEGLSSNIEPLFEETTVTHSSSSQNLAYILKDGVLSATRQGVSFSKAPQYAHNIAYPSYIAFDREGLEDHNRKKLTRPIYWSWGSSDTDIEPQIHPGSRRVRNVTGATITNLIRNLDIRPEDSTYKDEREVSSIDDVKFTPDHVKYLGAHLTVPMNFGVAGADHKNHFSKNIRAVVDTMALAKMHKKPFRLTMNMSAYHPDFLSYLRTGDHERIPDYKDALKRLFREQNLDFVPTQPDLIPHYPNADEFDAAVDSSSLALDSWPELGDHPVSAKKVHPNLRATL